MKNALIILLISLTSFYGTGCNTHPDIHSQTLPKDTTTTNTHDDYTQFYYKAESDTILTYEALQRQYDHYISLAWKAKLEGSLIDVLRHFEKAVQLNDSIQKLSEMESINIQDYQKVKQQNSHFKQIHHWLLLAGILLLAAWILRAIFIHIHKTDKKTGTTTPNKTDHELKLRIATFKQSELYQQILQAAKDDNINISPVSQPVLWISIQENLDILFSDFTKRLTEVCPDLSETEQQICWLSKLDIQPSGIARILKLSRQAITNARSRISKKMTSKEGESANFAHFIESL